MDAASCTVFGVLLAANGVDDNINYLHHKSSAKEKDCDIFKLNGGDMTDCKFPKYIRSQFIFDKQPF